MIRLLKTCALVCALTACVSSDAQAQLLRPEVEDRWYDYVLWSGEPVTVGWYIDFGVGKPQRFGPYASRQVAEFWLEYYRDVRGIIPEDSNPQVNFDIYVPRMQPIAAYGRRADAEAHAARERAQGMRAMIIPVRVYHQLNRDLPPMSQLDL